MKSTLDKILNILKTIIGSNIFKATSIFFIFSVFLYYIILIFDGNTDIIRTCRFIKFIFALPIFTFQDSLAFLFEYFFIRTHFLLNILLIFGFMLLIFGLIGKIKPTLIVSSSILFILGLVNHILMISRATPFTAADFASIGLAATMTGNFEFTFSKVLVTALICFAIFIVLIWRIEKINFSKIQLLVSRISALVISLFIFVIFFATKALDVPIEYDTTTSYKQNGLVLSFLTTIKAMHVTEPENYSIANIENLMSDIKPTSVNPSNITDSPNIIAIMNESFADLAEVYDINISEDNLPFIHSLEDNTIKGNVHSSSLGCRTANCEYEFLTR